MIKLTKFLKQNQIGAITLAELLTSLVILSIVISAAYGFLIQGIDIFKFSEAQTEVQRQARIAFTQLTKDIKGGYSLQVRDDYTLEIQGLSIKQETLNGTGGYSYEADYPWLEGAEPTIYENSFLTSKNYTIDWENANGRGEITFIEAPTEPITADYTRDAYLRYQLEDPDGTDPIDLTNANLVRIVDADGDFGTTGDQTRNILVSHVRNRHPASITPLFDDVTATRIHIALVVDENLTESPQAYEPEIEIAFKVGGPGSAEDGELRVDGAGSTWNGQPIPGGSPTLELNTNSFMNAGRYGIKRRIWHFRRVTIRNGGILTHSQGAGANTSHLDGEGLILYVQDTFTIEGGGNPGKIELTGKGYGSGDNAPKGSGGAGDAGGAGYGSPGGDAGGSWSPLDRPQYKPGAAGGREYGDAEAVRHMGAGTSSTRGGGRIKIVARNIMIENGGAIQANGQRGGMVYTRGGSAGGGIYLEAKVITIDNGAILSAAGGGGEGVKGAYSGPPPLEQAQDGQNGWGGEGGQSADINYCWGGYLNWCFGAMGGAGGAPGLAGPGGKGGGSNGGWAGAEGLPGGSSAGGGGAGNWNRYALSGGHGGGGAGRIVIYYETYNGGLVTPTYNKNKNPITVSPGDSGYAPPSSEGEIIGPWAYFVKGVSF